LDLELQILSRSTFLQLSPIVKNSELFIQRLSSCSVTAKHEFKSIYLHNSSHHNIRIPENYALFGIEGLTNQPNNAGDIFQLKNLTSILELPSKSKLFTPQDNQLYCDKEGKFIITCEHFLLSSFCAQDMAPDMSYSSLNIHCPQTRKNTKFNHFDVNINPTHIGNPDPNEDCSSRNCRVFNQNQVDANGVAPTRYWCDHSKISLKYVPESDHAIRDLEDIAGNTAPGRQDKQYTAATNQDFPGQKTNIWPAPDFPPQSQIIGDLPHIELPERKQHPPFVSNDHFNSLLFLSRLLRTQDNLSSKDIIAMQRSEPIFNQIFDNIQKHGEYKLDKNGI
jgi:hypothetical protein